jgi:putative tryptophan/tyrosine transport system substrate-binding protein
MRTRWLIVPLLLIATAVMGFRNPDADRPYRIGLLITDDTYLAPVQGFKDGMKELGYVEGQHVRYDLGNAQLDRAALQRLAQQFVRDRVDLIFTATYLGAASAKLATAGGAIPVVFGPAADPVELGLVKSITGSGNNLTGVSTLSLELTAKRMELLARLVPSTRKVGILYNPEDRFSKEVAKLARQTAERLHLTVVEVQGKSADEIVASARALRPGEVDALFAISDVLINNQVAPLAQIAREKRVPYMVHMRGLAEKGALASYGIDTYGIGKQSARLADKILNGAKPSDIPIETPRRLELVVNLAVAREIGARIPEQLLREADAILR